MRITKIISFYSQETGITQIAKDLDLEEIINRIRGRIPSEITAKLKSINCFEFDTQDRVQWELNFTGTCLGVSDIQGSFLRPLNTILDMNGIDQTFDHIAITHNRETGIDTVKIIITFLN